MTADALLTIIAGHDTTGLIEIRCRRPSDGKIAAREWFPLDRHRACLRFIAAKAPTLDVYIGAAPRTSRAGGRSDIRHAWCLWADLDTSEALDRLSAFTPEPSLVIRSGSGANVHAWWSLSEPLSSAWVERANRRLAHHLGADMKATDAARILRPPDTLNHKSSPPAKVTATLFRGCAMSVASVVKNLPDPRRNPPSARRAPRPNVNMTNPLLGISSEHYYTALTGRELSHGNVTCPFHGDGKERSPSMRLYGNGTWACFGCPPQGNGKVAGGGIIEFAARLWGLDTRGSDFIEIRERLLDALG